MFGSGEISKQGFQKSVLIILFLFITFALIITWNEPSIGFESSIFNSTPLVLWIALILSIIVGITIVIMSVSYSNFGSGNLWKYGLFLIFFCYAICWGLFIIRGYYMWGISGDPASHLGWVNEILQEGHTPPTLFYPITHIFLSEISLVTTINQLSLHKIIPFFFGLLLIVFIYLFVRVVSSNQIEPLIAVVIGCTFALDMPPNFTPNLLSNLLLPLALFSMFKYLQSSNKGWKILFFIILIFYPVFHPLPTIFLGLILLTLWIPQKLHDFWRVFSEKNHDLLNLNTMNIKLVIPFLILLIWFIFWYSLYYIWGYTLYKIYDRIISEGEPSKLSALTDQVSYAQGYGYNVIEIILKQYGNLIIFFIISLFSFFLLWKMVSRNQKQEIIFSLYGPWAIISIIIPVLYLFNLTFSPLRMLFYQAMLEIVFLAFFVSYILLQSRKSKRRNILWLANIAMIVLIVGLFLIGLLNLYPSPYNLSMNYQTTHSEISGMMFFYEYRNVSVPVSGIDAAVGRFADLLLTPKQKSVQHLPPYLRKEDETPWHFGYNQFPSIASSYNKETNLIIMRSDRLLYTDYYPDMAKYRFVPQDFERLKYDTGASFLYSNGGFDLLTIVPKG